MPTIAIQLFTLRDACGNDFAGALKRVAKIGFPAVEFGGFHGQPVSELKNILEDCSLRAVSGHFGFQMLRDQPETVIEEAKILGMEYVVCPYLDENLRKDAEGYRSVARILESVGRRLRENGLQLCYHHHAFEFKKFDGSSGIRLLLEQTDPEIVKFEIDTYWAYEGGENPAAFIREVGGRCPLLHLKDRAKDGGFAEVGSGMLDFSAIFSAAKKAGVAAYIVEQDECRRDPFECVETSLKFLKSKGF